MVAGCHKNESGVLIRVFRVLCINPAFPLYLIFVENVAYIRSFDARRECKVRKYSYFLPAEVVGINNYFTAAEIDCHLSELNDILNVFEVSLLSLVKLVSGVNRGKTEKEKERLGFVV